MNVNLIKCSNCSNIIEININRKIVIRKTTAINTQTIGIIKANESGSCNQRTNDNDHPSIFNFSNHSLYFIDS